MAGERKGSRHSGPWARAAKRVTGESRRMVLGRTASPISVAAARAPQAGELPSAPPRWESATQGRRKARLHGLPPTPWLPSMRARRLLRQRHGRAIAAQAPRSSRHRRPQPCHPPTASRRPSCRAAARMRRSRGYLGTCDASLAYASRRCACEARSRNFLAASASSHIISPRYRTLHADAPTTPRPLPPRSPSPVPCPLLL